MIELNLPVLMAKNKVFSISKLSEETGISRGTLSSLYYSRAKGVQFNTLSILCSYCNCSVGEIIEYKKEDSHEQQFTNV